MGAYDDILGGGKQAGGAYDDILDDSKKPGIIDKIKGGLSTAKDYGLAIAAGAGEGVANTEAGVGTFIQAPAANTLAGVTGAAALADRGITAASNYFAPGSAGLDQGIQDTARQASQFATEQRAANSDAGMIAKLGLNMQADGRERVKDIQAFNREYNPELVRQQQAMSQTEGFFGALEGIKDNPMAFTHMLSRSAPDMAVGAGVAKGVASGIAATGGSAARQVAGASTAGVIAESASSANQAREGVYQRVVEIPAAQLAASPRFNELLAATSDAGKAREILANELADQAPILAGAGTAAGSMLTNKLFGGDATARMIAGTEKTTGMASLKNAGQESFEEVAQGVPEDLVQHGAVAQADPTAKFDLGKTIAENAAAGLAMGGGGSAASYFKDNFGKPEATPALPPQLPDSGPMSRSANLALASGAAATADTVLGVPQDTTAIEPKSATALDRVFEIDQQLQTATQEQAPSLHAERDSITAAWPASVAGMATSFSTESGSRITASYALMDAADLTTSHDEKLKPSAAYPKEMQPRERDRAASELQISGIAQRLDPARLGESADAATGAPIVGADGLVESGNARTIALKRVYQGNPTKAEEYKQFLRANAVRFGLTPEAIDAMPSPVLVRVRETPVDRAEFARQANASTVAQMSSSEVARSDAARLDTMDDLNPDESGDFIASRDFIRRFVSRLPGTEQAGMIDAGGQLSQAGYARIRNAVLAKAYGDSPVLARMVESLDDNLRNVGKALMQAAPAVAKMRQEVGEGALFDADITPDLLGAVEALSRVKEAGRSVSDALSQVSMFDDGISPEAQDLLSFLDQNIRKPRKIAEFIQRYVEALRAAGNPNQGSLLGEQSAPAKQDIINAAKEQGNATAEPTGQPRGNQATDQQSDRQPGGAQRDGGSAQGNAAANDEVNSDEWRMFGQETGTLGIPRAQMPQVAIRLRPAMLAFLETKGIGHIREDVAADELKPTQAEYSTVKAERAGALAEDRSDASAVLLSSDGYVLDGHHRWIAKAQQHQPINVIRFDAPIDRLMDAVREFSGATVSTGSPELLAKRTQAVERFYDAAGDLAQIVSKRSRAAIVPENLPGLMPTLVKLFDSAFDVVGTDVKRSTAWVKERLKAIPEFRALWNKILPETYRKAALQAVEQYDPNKPLAGGQMGLFDAPKKAAPAQGDMFMGQKPAPKVAMIDGRPYDSERDNFKPVEPTKYFTKELLAEADGFVKRYYTKEQHPMTDADRAEAERLIAGNIKKAEAAKAEYDEKIIAIAKRTGALGQMLAGVKGIKRSAEKMWDDARDAGGRPMETTDVKDLLRSTIVVQSYSDAQKVLDAIFEEFRVMRVKDKSAPDLREKQGAYADISANVFMPNGTVAEIQINIPAMLVAKENQGHKLFEAARSLPSSDPKKAEILDAMRGTYAAAFAFDAAMVTRPVAENSLQPAAQPTNAASEIGAQFLAGNAATGNKSAPLSSSLNTLPSGNTANSSPLNEDQNSQPAGNTSGNFISTTSDSSIAEGTNTSYTEGNGNASGVPNEQHGNRGTGSAEGKIAVADAAVTRERGTGRIRPRDGRGNQQSDSGADRGDSQQQRTPGGTEGRGSDKSNGDTKHGSRDGKRSRIRGNAGVSAGRSGDRRDPPVKTGRNYRFGDGDLTYAGGWQAKARQNIEAVELLKKLQAGNLQATREEQAVLAKFIGWGSSEMANSIFGDKLTKRTEALGQYEAAIATMDRLKRNYLTRSDTGFYQAFMVMQAKTEGLNYYQIPQITREELDKAKPDTGARKWGELRDRLKAALTKEEWEAASRSTQYAHYTSKPVVNAMMKALSKMGFKGGTILEPGSGIGVFPGLMPVEMGVNSVYTGIEFDPITGGILKQLFPDERILVESFVDSKLPENFYDVAFGNPPFSSFKILGDPKYAKLALALHDYFFAKTIDSVKPGGLVMFVTSRYTMDKKDDKARAYMAERADLVGAIRLPQTAFQKNAGTEVVTDVLFLRKKVPGQTFDKAQPWAGLGEVKTEKDTALVNEYFAAHPEMVLGTHSRKGSMYGKDEYTVLPTGSDIEAQFAKAAALLPENVFVEGRGSAAEAAKIRDMDFNPKAKKEGSFYVTDAGILMQREGGVGVRAEEKNQKNAALLKDFVALRDAIKQAQFDQLNDGDWEKSLGTLRKSYASFVEKNGQINQFTSYMQKVKTDEVDEDGVPTGNRIDDEELRRKFPLRNKISDDPEWTLVTALEDFNDETGEIRPSDWLTKRTLGAPAVADIQTPTDALLASLDESGGVDIEAIADRIGLSEQEAIDALGTLIYEDPALGWVMGDEYLSGNVKKKLAAAEEAAKNDKRYLRNVDALKSVQPTSKVAEDITPQIGMNWIPGPVYEQFLKEGKADKGLKGEKFVRLERRAPIGEGVMDLQQSQGPGETNPQKKGKLLEVIYWPAGEAMPAKYSVWDQSGTWEVRDTKGGKLIVWRDFTKQERVAMGEIDEARYAIAKSLHGMVQDVETGRYLEWIAKTYAKKPGEVIEGEIIDASERMRDVFKPGEWVQVPETKIAGTSVTKYGLLAGRYLPGPIWNDVRQTVGFRFKPLGETYAAILSAWKTSKTALSPAVHTNNVMANFVMADWHDVGAGHIAKALRIILGASQRDGKALIGKAGNVVSRAGIADAEAAREIVNRYLDSGANLGSWVTAELQKEQLEPLLDALEKELGTVGESAGAIASVSTILQLFKAKEYRQAVAQAAISAKGSAPVDYVRNEAGNLIGLYEAEDQVFRLAAWLKAKEDGASDLAAGRAARKSFLDYNINAPWIQALRNTALPFISFSYRAIPMMLETMAKKPHKLLKLAMMAGGLNALGYLLGGGDEDDERALLPEEKAGRIWGLVPKLIRMPWDDQNGAPVFLDIRRFVPVGDVFDTGMSHSAVPLLPALTIGGPLALVAEFMANKSQFTGKPITLETDTPAEKAQKTSDWLYKAFAPNIIVLPGTYAWTGVANAAKGRTDSFGQEQSTPMAVSSAFGVKLGSYPKDVLQLNAQRATQAKMMEIDRNISQLKRERQRNGIDDEEFQSKLDSQIVKKQGIAEEFQRKMAGGK